MDYVDTIPTQPAEACTEIGFDDAVPEGFSIAALFVLALLLVIAAAAACLWAF